MSKRETNADSVAYATTVYQRHPDWLGADVGVQALLLNQRTNDVFELNSVAAIVWHHLASTLSFDALFKKVVEDFDAPADECAVELNELLSDLIRLGVITRRPGQQSGDRAGIGQIRSHRDGGFNRLTLTRTLPPEFQLCVACCRWNFAEGDPGVVRELSTLVNWSALIRYARYHRVHGLVWNCLSKLGIDIPGSAAAGLAADGFTIAAKNLAIVLECQRLMKAFDGQGLPAFQFIKGMTVARIAYANPFAKMAWDIDILILPDELSRAVKVLEMLGYSLEIPAFRDALDKWHGPEKESVWKKSSPEIYIELHTRLADNLHLIPSITAKSPQQKVYVAPDIAVPTLADEELFAYLAVHGSSSAWFRLKWISDFAGFLNGRTGDQIETLYRRSQSLAAGRAPGQALLLADTLFGTLANAPALRDELQSQRPVTILAQAGLKQLTIPPREPTEHLFGTARIHWTQLLMMPGIGFKASELWRQTTKVLHGR